MSFLKLYSFWVFSTALLSVLSGYAKAEAKSILSSTLSPKYSSLSTLHTVSLVSSDITKDSKNHFSVFSLGLTPQQLTVFSLKPLSRVQVHELLLLNNPSILEADLLVDSAKQNLIAQYSLWYPSLTLSASSFPIITRASAQATSYGTQTAISTTFSMNPALTAQWALINFKRIPTINIARDQLQKAFNTRNIVIRDVLLSSDIAYFDLQQADSNVSIAKESLLASATSLKNARVRFLAGRVTKIDVLDSEVQFSRDNQFLQTSLSNQYKAQRTLASLINLAPNLTPVALDKVSLLGRWSSSLEESIAASLKHRDELKQVLLDISMAEKNSLLAKYNLLPLINFYASFTHANSDVYNDDTIVASSSFPRSRSHSNDTSYGLNFNWPLFDGGASNANYRAQLKQAEAAGQKFVKESLDTKLKTETYLSDLTKFTYSIFSSSTELRSARESYRLSLLRQAAGLLAERDVINSQRDYNNANIRHSIAIADYNKALVALQRFTGLSEISPCSLAMDQLMFDEVYSRPVSPEALFDKACK